MANFVGSLVNIGIGKETTRGTLVNPGFYLPKSDFSVLDKAEITPQNAPYGVIEETMESDVTKRWSEGNITAPMTSETIGLLLGSLFGEFPTPGNPESGVYTHAFDSFTQSNTHQSLSIHRIDSNENIGYANSMIQDFEIKYELGSYITTSIGFMGKASTTASSTASYSQENFFRPQDVTFKMASTQAGLTASNAITVESLTLSINKNLKEYQALGDVDLNEIFNGRVSITGSVTLLWDSTTYKDYFTGGTNRAVRIDIENTKDLIGATEYPSLRLDLYKTNVDEWATEESNDDIVKQTFGFSSRYSLTDDKTIVATLTNTTSSY